MEPGCRQWAICPSRPKLWDWSSKEWEREDECTGRVHRLHKPEVVINYVCGATEKIEAHIAVLLATMVVNVWMQGLFFSLYFEMSVE